MKLTNNFVDYLHVVNIPLLPKCIWTRPTIYWLAMKYHGKICTKTGNGRILNYSLTKDGYYYQNDLNSWTWQNDYSHVHPYSGISGGILFNKQGNILSQAKPCFNCSYTKKGKKGVYNIFDFIVDKKKYVVCLEYESSFGFIHDKTRLCLYDASEVPIIQTDKVGYYHEIIILQHIDDIEILFPVFFSIYYNFSWDD